MTKTKALRLYGKKDLRLEDFELPEIADDEILADVQTNSICMSTYKLYNQGEDHKRAPNDVAEHPIIVGHEMCGNILQVGAKYGDKYQAGGKYTVQPALTYPGREWEAPGYSFRTFGGHATKVILPREVMERDCLLGYAGEAYFFGSLVEVMSCIVGGFNVQYHFTQGSYEHKMGLAEDGALALLGGTGPMGLGAIDYALHGPRKPRILVVTDIDPKRLNRAEELFPVEEGKKQGIELHYVNTGGEAPVRDLMDITDGKGYEDVFVFAPVAPLVSQGSEIMGSNGCLNFFAGPTDTSFKATINFYNVHYAYHHVAANSGGNTDDMRIALKYMGDGSLNPSVMLTHIGGLASAAEAIAHLPDVPAGKRCVYTHKDLPMVAIADFAELGKSDPFYASLAEICARHGGLWSLEAEQYLLTNAPDIA